MVVAHQVELTAEDPGGFCRHHHLLPQLGLLSQQVEVTHGDEAVSGAAEGREVWSMWSTRITFTLNYMSAFKKE